MSIPDASISPADMVNRCPNIKHTYSFSLVCGSIESDWLTLDSEKHLISIKTPLVIEQQGKQVKVQPAVINVEVIQQVQDELGNSYASVSQGFEINVGGQKTGGCSSADSTQSSSENSEFR